MAPIRVAIIGLSAGSDSWAARAHLPYLKQASDKYTIVALCNSSEEAAKRSITAHGLDPSTKTYGSPHDLAADPDVDLAVCSVRVDRHYDAIKPSLEAGKDCFVEWPLAKDLDEATDLLAIADKTGAKVMVGLQAQKSPVTEKIKELVHQGAIGKVLSSTTTFSAAIGGTQTPERIFLINDKRIGGNVLTIPFIHVFDAVLFVLGEMLSLNAVVSTQHKEVEVIDGDGKTTRVEKRTSPDHVSLVGLLESGAQCSATARPGPPFKAEPGMVWRIYGEKGEIEVAGASFALSMGLLDITIRVHDRTSDSVDVVEWKKQVDPSLELPIHARNVGGLYDAFASGGAYPDWKWAVKRHCMIQAIYDSSEDGFRKSYVK